MIYGDLIKMKELLKLILLGILVWVEISHGEKEKKLRN